MPGVTVIKAQHMTEMRVALRETFSAAGMTAPIFTATTPQVTVIAAAHIREMRDAVLTLEYR